MSINMKNNIIEFDYYTEIRNLTPEENKNADFYLIETLDKNFDKEELQGLSCIANDELAIVLLAGGMSTRLSVSYPKGMYSIGLPSCKSLFQLTAERLLKVKQLACDRLGKQREATGNSSIPLYIMTSEHTDLQTREFFSENDFFGLSKDRTVFFKQDELPCFADQNSLLLDEQGQVCTAPDGTGGLLKALLAQNIIHDMKQRSIKYVHVCCINNVLAKYADPAFTGLCVLNNIECAFKASKSYLGNEPINQIFYNENDSTRKIIDYSLKYLTKANDYSSEIRMCDMGYYMFSLDLLQNLCRDIKSLKYYKLPHKVNTLNENGKVEKKDCFKLESFLTDYLPGNARMIVVSRGSEYSPLVNIQGSRFHSKKQCKDDLINLHYSWLIRAGALFHYPSDRTIGIRGINRRDSSEFESLPDLCEISPLVSYAGENLSDLVSNKCFEPPLVLDFDRETSQFTFNGLEFRSYSKSYPTEIRIKYYI